MVKIKDLMKKDLNNVLNSFENMECNESSLYEVLCNLRDFWDKMEQYDWGCDYIMIDCENHD